MSYSAIMQTWGDTEGEWLPVTPVMESHLRVKFGGENESSLRYSDAHVSSVGLEQPSRHPSPLLAQDADGAGDVHHRWSYVVL